MIVMGFLFFTWIKVEIVSIEVRLSGRLSDELWTSNLVQSARPPPLFMFLVTIKGGW